MTRSILLLGALLIVIACLATGWQAMRAPVLEIEFVPCRMGWYDTDHWVAHYTMVPVIAPFEDPARACDAIPPCGDPPIEGHGCP